VSFCSDAGSLAPEGVFLKSSTHPRAYGTFARLLGKYVRQERVIPLEEAVRRLTSLPAENLKLDRRGRLQAGHHADVVVFDPQTITDHATYEKPHQYATGVIHVFVNGTQVLKDGEHTGATPGQVVRGPGWKGPGTAQYAVDPTWPRKPEQFKWGHMPGVAVDSYDRVYLFNRSEPAVQVYRADGVLVRTWSIDDVGGAHGLRIGPGNTVWTTDITNHVLRKYDTEGRLLLTLGEFGRAGADERHFDRPTDVTVLPNGEIYVTDGYGNRRVVHFDAAGRYIAQWGQAGTGPGQFALPHAIVADSRNRLYVADRENARIQVFDRDGKLLDVWADVVTPWGLHMTGSDELWVCGSSPTPGANPGEWTVVPPPDQVVMKLSREGRVLLRVPLRRGTSAPRPAGEVDWVHGIALDSQGNLYLGDIQGQRIQKFTRQP
jgi:hypothetical protein